MFCEIIGEVSSSWSPVYTEHFLRFFTSHPIKAHVSRLASLALHVVVEHTVGYGIIGLKGYLALGVTHLDEGIPC